MFARLIATLFGTAPRTPVRNATRFRPQVEGLEARDVPTALYWNENAPYLDLYTPNTSFYAALNWYPVQVPKDQDDLFFGVPSPDPYAPTSQAPNKDCSNMGVVEGTAGGPGPGSGGPGSASTGWINSLHVLNDYSGTISLTSQQSFTEFELRAPAAKIAQPAYYDNDFSVSGTFDWTAGTLNSSDHVANVILDGATGNITPVGAGTVMLGSNLSVINAAVVTAAAGTVMAINDHLTIAINSGGGFVVDPGPIAKFEIVTSSQSELATSIGPTGYAELRTGRYRFTGLLVNVGRVTLKSNTHLILLGTPNYIIAFDQPLGLTELGGGSKLETDPLKTIELRGRLVTHSDGTTSDATIKTSLLNILAEVVIDDGNGYHTFGTLLVDGNVNWTGGTYRPVVLGIENNGPADLWHSTGTFTVGGSAKIALGSIDHEHSQVPPTESNWTWEIIRGDGGIQVQAGSNPPSVEGYFVLDPVAGNPVKRWNIKSKID